MDCQMIEQEEVSFRGDLWDLYLAEHIHRDAACWTAWHVIKLLSSEWCEDVEVVSPLLPQHKAVEERYVTLKIVGECHDGRVTLQKDLHAAEMSLEQRKAIVSLVREKYRTPFYKPLREAVAKALNVLIYNK